MFHTRTFLQTLNWVWLWNKNQFLHKIVLILWNEMRYSRQKYSALDLWLRNFRHKKSPKNARKCSFFDWNTMSWILGQKQSRQMLAKPSSFFAPNTHIFKRLLQKRVNPKSIKQRICWKMAKNRTTEAY